eukprot:3269221-Rhodomonas_salina.1
MLRTLIARYLERVCEALVGRHLRGSRSLWDGIQEALGRFCEAGECKALAHLDLELNRVGDEGAGRLADALGECKALAHLNLTCAGTGLVVWVRRVWR